MYSLKKTVIVAIVGKSGTGKSTLAKKLQFPQILTHKLIQTTTRPPREGEVPGRDYWFVNDEQFKDFTYIDAAKFKNWYYGTAKRDIYSKYLNIGVFNVKGLSQVIQWVRKNDEYRLIPVYIKEKFSTRLRRLIARDGFKFETVRRLWSDFWDFKKIEPIITSHWILLYNIDNIDKQTKLCADRVYQYLNERQMYQREMAEIWEKLK